jgi:hypothetical protein
MEHKRSLKRKRGQDVARSTRPVGRSAGNPPRRESRDASESVHGSEYRPLSRPPHLVHASMESHPTWSRGSTTPQPPYVDDRNTAYRQHEYWEREASAAPRGRQTPAYGNISWSPPPILPPQPPYLSRHQYATHSYIPYDEYQSLSMPEVSHNRSMFTSTANGPYIPPGAYVNPAFFNGPNATATAQQTQTLPTDIQHHLDLFRNPPHQKPG